MDPVTTETILDDAGVEHKYALISLDLFKSITILNRLVEFSEGDFLDHILDSAVFGTRAEEAESQDSEAEPVAVAIERTASRIYTSGDKDLIMMILANTSRDGVKLADQMSIAQAYTGNLGEMRRALEAVLRRHFLDFFDHQVGPLRQWGARLADKLKANFQLLFGNGSAPSAIAGLFGNSGLRKEL